MIGVHEILGKRVRVRAIKHVGSARLLHGLTGIVTGEHPIAPDWVKIQLDENSITPHQDWSIPISRLIPCE